MRLAIVAVVLAVFCIITFTLNEIHDHIVAQAPETSAVVAPPSPRS
jgi:hypothetical protein